MRSRWPLSSSGNPYTQSGATRCAVLASSTFVRGLSIIAIKRYNSAVTPRPTSSRISHGRFVCVGTAAKIAAKHPA